MKAKYPNQSKIGKKCAVYVHYLCNCELEQSLLSCVSFLVVFGISLQSMPEIIIVFCALEQPDFQCTRRLFHLIIRIITMIVIIF